MKEVNNIVLGFLLIAMMSLLFVGCGDEINSKNMEQLYADQGIPVKTQLVKKIEFSKGLEYNAVLTGYKESSAITSIASKVEKIHYQIGDFVEKDAVIMSFPTDDPSVKYFQSKLTYENAIAAFERMKEFYKAGGLSKNDYESSETNYKIAEANWNSVKQSVLFKSPISGIITRFNVRESENVLKDQELFTVSQLDKVKARIWVSDFDIQNVHIGQSVSAKWQSIILSGEVVQVDLSMNQVKKAFAVDVLFNNSKKEMLTGITAKIKIETYKNANSIFINRRNILKKDQEQFVYLNNNGVAKKQVIQTGETSGTEIEILEGLQPGDKLIIEGQMLLKNNNKINLITN